MDNLKTALCVGGIAIVASGVVCLPVRDYVFSKRDLSTFHNWAGGGAFVQMGVGLIVVGLLVLAVSFLIPGDMTD